MHPLELSANVIDSGIANEPVNRVTNELSELASGLALVESFSHSAVVDTGDGLVVFDASGPGTGAAVVTSMRQWNSSPVSHLVYTHGHADHVGGSGAFAADSAQRGTSTEVVAHRRVLDRLDRYEMTNNWNVMINKRQFGGVRSDMGLEIGSDVLRFLPRDTLRPSVTFDATHHFSVGELTFELHHARGETDDHLWAFVPERKWLFSGDFVIWNFPNAGNPQKVQRYALEWATALREMIAAGPELLVPAHGLPVEGRERIATVLGDIASALETIVTQVVAMMNAGETLDSIVHTVRVPDEVLTKPYLRPLYDEPEFVVRNIWRLYGGWWDGAASRLKPAPDAVVARELAELSGGAGRLLDRAEALVDSDMRLACHLADLAGWAEPDSSSVHARRADIYERRRAGELSLMSKGIFSAAARESRLIAEGTHTERD